MLVEEADCRQTRIDASPAIPFIASRLRDYGAMLGGIIGVRFAIDRLEGKWKMSQNRATKDWEGVVEELGRRGDRDGSRNGRNHYTPNHTERLRRPLHIYEITISTAVQLVPCC